MDTQQIDVMTLNGADDAVEVLDLVPEMLGLVGGGSTAPVVCFE